MKFITQRRLAASILKASKQNVWFDPEHLKEIKESITKADIRSLIEKGFVQKIQKTGYSRGRARIILKQKRKGRRRGLGSRKGKKYARLPRKTIWMNRIRAQRRWLKQLKQQGKITTQVYSKLYKMSKGGFFRSRGHMNVYLKEHGVAKHEGKKEDTAVPKKT